MSRLESAPKELSIQLPDGRRLGYAEYGVPNGRPVLFFHGSLGSSYIHADMAEIAKQRSVRLIAVDRPGYGLSDSHAGRTFLTWADDIATLTDILGAKHFSIVGFSSGNPYALACAYKLPDRVQMAALAGALIPGVTEGIPPMMGQLYALAQTNPAELRKTIAAVAPSAVALAEVAVAAVSDWDREVLNNRAAQFELEYSQALRQGTEGIASDFIVFSGNWGFPIKEIKTEVHLWSGTQDQNTPPAMTHYLASQLPNSHIHVLQDEGHCALYGHWDEILKCEA